MINILLIIKHMNKCFFIVLTSSITISLYCASVVMLMGPSCAGKSTLAQLLCTHLNTKNEPWHTLDFDDVEEKIELLITKTNEYLDNNINVIIDTNCYENNMENTFKGALHVKKIIISAPLDILLQRDEMRTEKLNRNNHRAYWCRHFVIESFNKSLTWPADFYIDSFTHSEQENCMLIVNYLHPTFNV